MPSAKWIDFKKKAADFNYGGNQPNLVFRLSAVRQNRRAGSVRKSRITHLKL
jgi:hypothetical protein